MKKELKGKVAALLAGVVFALLLLEAGLRCFGYLYKKTHSLAVSPAGAVTVLCLGDSFTVGLGAPAEKSYPAQLQDALNKKKPGPAFRVVNGGVIGQNTSELLSKLQADLDSLRPHAVVVMTALSNGWNLRGFQRAQGKRGAFVRIREYLARSSGFRFYKLMGTDWRGEREEAPGAGPASGRTGGRGPDCAAQGLSSEAGLQCYIKSAKAAPSDPVSRAEAGFLLLNSGRLAEAGDWFRAGIGADGKYPVNYAGLGLVAMTEGRLEEAAGWFHGEIAAGRKDASVCFRLGTLAKLAGKPDKAREWHQKGIALDPSYGLNYSALAWLALERKDHAQARSWVAGSLGKNIKNRPGRREDRFALAADLRALGALVVAAGPGHGGEAGGDLINYARPGEVNGGISLYGAGRYPQAIAWFERRLKEDPSDARANTGKGLALWTTGRAGPAAEAFLESLRLDTSQTDNYYHLGMLFRKLGRAEEAFQWYKEGIRAGSAGKDNENYPPLADILTEFRMYSAAADFFSAAASVNPALNDLLEGVRAGGGHRAEKDRWIRNDLEAIVALCRKAHVRVILMNYPANADYPSWGRLSRLIAETAKNNKVPLVDNYSVFSALGARGGAGGYFAADGHCNAKGYALVAGSAAAAVLAPGGAAR
ncbi:MAG TPA: tetratricopeptide repeat protein [Elusimicrobiales bacterium]|nr:tetratricopeptide repeat protein [Elusimicrobiales bacterium]